MKKKTLLLCFVSLFSMSLFSQTTNKKIDAQINDPKRAENAAKADVYVNKKMTRDSLSRRLDQSSVPIKKHKGKYCKKPKNV